MLRFGLATFAAAALACGHAAERKEPLSNRAPAASGTLTVGEYACRLDEGGYHYPPFRCVVSRRGSRTWLEKVGGSVRLRGWLTPHGDGFGFDGELFCPWGDCTEHVTAELASDGHGDWRATMSTAQAGPMTMTLAYAQGGFGGAGYGGDGYGGGAYGGYGYGMDPSNYDDP
jgi:hypothetical protein